MVWHHVIKIPRKHVKSKSKSLEEHSFLITPNGGDQPLSDAQLNNINKNHRHHHHHPPKGFVAVYVGPHHRRFLVPTRFLSVPDFKALMDQAAEEFGYEQQGGLRIPCDEHDFQKLLADCSSKFNSNTKSKSKSESYIHTHFYYTTPV